MNKKVYVFLSLPLIALVLIFLFFESPWTPLTEEKEVLRGRPLGGDFILQSEQGAFRMSSLNGSVVLIYFGFTSCPDICPTTLSNVAAAFKKMSAQEIDQVKLLFITVDPERDTLEKLKAYSAYFHFAIIPLSGSEEQLKVVAESYGAYFRKAPIKSALGYTMDHSTNIFVVDKQGAFVDVISYSSSPDEIVRVIQKYLL